MYYFTLKFKNSIITHQRHTLNLYIFMSGKNHEGNILFIPHFSWTCHHFENSTFLGSYLCWLVSVFILQWPVIYQSIQCDIPWEPYFQQYPCAYIISILWSNYYFHNSELASKKWSVIDEYTICNVYVEYWLIFESGNKPSDRKYPKCKNS